MNELPKRLLQILAILLVTAITVAFPMAWMFAGYALSGVTAFVLLRNLINGGRNDMSLSSYERNMQKAMLRQQSISERAEREKHYSRKEGWKPESLPVGMVMSMPSKKNAESVIVDLDGMRKSVVAKRSKEGVNFSFSLRNESDAVRVQEMIASGNIEASVGRGADGSYLVSSTSADIVAHLLRSLYPSRECEWKSEVTHERQYIVEGCNSYDEAVEKFKANRDAYDCVASRIVCRDGTDGNMAEKGSQGELLDRTKVVSLPIGAYVVTESTVDREQAMVRIPGDITNEEDIRDFADHKVQSGALDTKHSSEVSYSDGTPQNVTRHLMVNGADPVFLNTDREIGMVCSNLKAYAIVNDVDGILQGANALPQNTIVVVGSEAPKVRNGLYVMELPMGMEEIRNSVNLQNGVTPEVISAAQANGISAAQVRLSSLLNVVSKEGSADARLMKDVPIASGKINGVPVLEFMDRIHDKDAPALNHEQSIAWLNEASKIKSLDITVDPVRCELRITAQVGNQVLKRTEKLSAEDLQSLHGRVLSEAGKKDLLMMAYPSVFKTYRAAGSTARSMFADPVRAFIKGEKPKLAGPAKQKPSKPQTKKAPAKGPKVS